MTGIEARLTQLGIALPEMTPPVANYVPWVRSGSLVYVSGQIPMGPDKTLHYVGAVGEKFSVEDGRKAARMAAINVLVAVKDALDGDLNRVVRVLKVTGFVNAGPGFSQHPDVVNGASDLFVEVFGEAGRHARAAVGASSLPRNVAVEIEAIFEVS